MGDSVVRVAGGELRGASEASVRSFLGVPFSRPPVGSLRFRPPQPVEGWAGVRDARHFGPAAMQVRTILETARGLTGPLSEDCLTLNVWTPDEARIAGPLPVLVWIHGGSFVNGSGSVPWYDGTALAAHGDVVVVTINYRLGPFGFLDLADIGGGGYAGAGNAGLLDQITALRWVRDNIAAFGGDPHVVCIVGESAGAMSVGTLLATEAAKGLFHRAILQSGAPLAQSHAASTHVATELFRALGLDLDRGGLDRLGVLSASEIVDAANQVALRQQAAAFTGTGGSFAWAPVVDGVVLHEPPMGSVAGGASSSVPVLIGTTADEMRIARVLAPDLEPVDRLELARRLTSGWGEDGPDILAGYEAMYPADGPDDLWWSIASDRTFGLPTAAFTDARARLGAPTWAYRFAWRSPVRDGYFGSAHTMEIPFVFGTFDAIGAPELLGEVTPAMEVLRGRMQDAWVAFATTGCPGIESLPEWPDSRAVGRPTMVLDEICRVVDDPVAPAQALWAGVAGSESRSPAHDDLGASR
jgi:para-nitrobenzyl esterase